MQYESPGFIQIAISVKTCTDPEIDILDLMKYVPAGRVRYDTDLDDEILPGEQ